MVLIIHTKKENETRNLINEPAETKTLSSAAY